MLRLLHPLINYTLAATDGHIGHVKDLLFDEGHWTVRYLVADTGNWLPGRKVLISPISIGAPDWASKAIPVRMTKQQIKQQPDLSEDEPVSRQHETKWAQTYEYPYYWAGAYAWGNGVAPAAMFDVDAETHDVKQSAHQVQGDPQLRSLHEVRSYHINTADGEIGRIKDLIIDDETWAIRYVVVDTRKWLPGGEVILAPGWFDSISWASETMHCTLAKEAVKNAPAFDPHQPVNRDYEEKLFDYYGKPAYWNNQPKEML